MPTFGGGNPCSPGAGDGDMGSWPLTPGYQTHAEVDGIAVPLSQGTWIYTGLTLTTGQGLAAIAGGRGQFNAGSTPYCYPEGRYGDGLDHVGYDPNEVVQNFYSGDVVANVTGAALALAITANSSTPPSAGHGAAAITNGLYPMRSSFFTAAQCNGGAGGAVWAIFNDSNYTDNSCSFSLNLRSLDLITGGGTVTNFSFTTAEIELNGGCAAEILIQLVDQNGNPVNAGAGGQSFTLSDNGTGTFSPRSPVQIPDGLSYVSVIYTNPNAGTFNVTVTPGGGPLMGGAAQVVPAVINCSKSDPNTCLCQITRPDFRDAIRRKIGIVPPIDQGLGPAGAQPLGQPYPDNAILNQVIADALRTVSRRTNFHLSVGLTTAVTAQTANGPLVIPMMGLQGCPTSATINTIRRVTFTDSSGNTYRLTPSGQFELDRERVLFDTIPPGIPRRFWIEGYAIYVSPAPNIDGTLTLDAGTGISQFCSDSAVIDELPTDYQQVIEDWGALYVCMYMPTSPRPPLPGLLQRLPLWKEMAEKGIDEILKWQGQINEEYQPSLAAGIYRRRRIR